MDARGARSLRDMTFPQRFALTFGYDQTLFEHLVKYAENWINTLFFPDELKQKTTIEASFAQRKQYQIPLQFPKFSPASWKNTGNDLRVTVKKSQQSSDFSLKPEESSLLVPLGRNASILNLDGHIVSIQWFPSFEPLFAVSIIKNSEGLPNIIGNPDLSIFSTDTSLETHVQIFRYDPATNSVSLYTDIVTTDIGVSSDLTWVACEAPLGVLIGTFGDGKVHLFAVPEVENSNPIKYDQYVSYEWSDESGRVPLSSYCLLPDNRLVVGTSDGYIVEFALDGTMTPSLVRPVSESAITSITAADPEGALLLFVQCFDSESFIFDYSNMSTGLQRSSLLSTISPQYHLELKSMLMIEHADSIGYVQVRCPQERPANVLKSDSLSAFLVCQSLGHPLVLVGDCFGGLTVVNIARKILCKAKSTSKTLIPLKLWRLTVKESNLVLEGDYVPIPSEKPLTKMSFAPPEVMISSIAWCESPKAASVYAAGTYSGLLIVEKLNETND